MIRSPPQTHSSESLLDIEDEEQRLLRQEELPTERNEHESVEGNRAGTRNQQQQIMETEQDGGPANHLMARAAEIEAIQSCRLPSFWRTNPELWFVQVESAFQLNRIRSEDAKYNMVVSMLDPDSLQEVADIVRGPPETGKYVYLKNAILNRLTDSADRQLRRLLTQLELGDKRPSQLLRQMKNLAGDRVSEDVLRVKWLDLLPPSVQKCLKILKAAGLEELAAVADELSESGPSIMATTTSVPTLLSVNSVNRDNSCINNNNSDKNNACVAAIEAQSVASLASEIASLRFAVSKLTEITREILVSVSRPSRDTAPINTYRRNPRSRSRSVSPAQDKTNGLCYYHQRFGAAAKACKLPCQKGEEFAASLRPKMPGNQEG